MKWTMDIYNNNQTNPVLMNEIIISRLTEYSKIVIVYFTEFYSKTPTYL